MNYRLVTVDLEEKGDSLASFFTFLKAKPENYSKEKKEMVAYQVFKRMQGADPSIIRVLDYNYTGSKLKLKLEVE